MIRPPPNNVPKIATIRIQKTVGEICGNMPRYPSSLVSVSMRTKGNTYAKPEAAALNTNLTVLALLRSLNEGEISEESDVYGTCERVEAVFHTI